MKNLNSFNNLVTRINETRNLSKQLFRIHELAIHQLNPDELTKEIQTCLYFLFSTAKAVKKIEKKALKQEVIVSEIESTNLVDLINEDAGQLSDSLVLCHNLICHRIHLMHFTPKVQNSLYFVFETSKLIRAIEEELKLESNGE